MITLSTNTVTAREAANSLSQLLDRTSSGQQTLITRKGKLAAVLIDPALWDDLQLLVACEAEHLRNLADAAATRVAAGEALDSATVRQHIADWRLAHGHGPMPTDVRGGLLGPR